MKGSDDESMNYSRTILILIFNINLVSICLLFFYLRRRLKRKIANCVLNENKTELIFANKYKVSENRSKANHQVLIFDITNKPSIPICNLEVINTPSFDLKNFGNFLDCRFSNNDYTSDNVSNCDVAIPYFNFFRINSETRYFHSFQTPTNIYRLVDFKNTNLRDLIGTDKAKSVDNTGDGNCFYYSVLFSIYEALKDPVSATYKRFFDLKTKASSSLVHKICGFDEIRLIAILSLLQSKRFNALTRYQLFDIVFYFKMLICIEIADNIQLYRSFMTNMSEYQIENFLSNYFQTNGEIEPMVISNILNYKFEIINVETGISKYANPRMFFKMMIKSHTMGQYAYYISTTFITEL